MKIFAIAMVGALLFGVGSANAQERTSPAPKVFIVIPPDHERSTFCKWGDHKCSGDFADACHADKGWVVTTPGDGGVSLTCKGGTAPNS